MLNSLALDDETVAIFFDMMIWLTAQYGAPIKQTVPKVITPEQLIHERCWGEDDPRTIFAWAEAEAAYLSKICKMENWSVQVAPNGNKAKLQNASKIIIQAGSSPANGQSLTPLRSNAWCENQYPGYFVDYFGRPTFFYDPRRCAEAGYFAKTILPQFALLKIYAKHPPAEFGSDSIEKLVQMTACHMGLGFTLLALSQGGAPKNWTPLSLLSPGQPDDEELPYLYGTLISMAAHRLTREQILATYSKMLTPRTHKLIGPAYGQIQAQTKLLKLLKILSKPTHSAHPEHSHLHQVQVSNGPV